MDKSGVFHKTKHRHHGRNGRHNKTVEGSRNVWALYDLSEFDFGLIGFDYFGLIFQESFCSFLFFLFFLGLDATAAT